MPPPQISVGAVIVLVGEVRPVLSWFTPTRRAYNLGLLYGLTRVHIRV